MVVFVFLMIRRPPRSTLSLHDALPIYLCWLLACSRMSFPLPVTRTRLAVPLCVFCFGMSRSEEHTSELQSSQYIACPLLLEKKTSQPFRSPTPISVSPHPALTTFRTRS